MRMRTSVALVAALAVSTGACFPNNAHYRTIAKYSEGGAILAGLAILAVAKTGADCRTDVANMPDADCQDRAELVGDVGLGLLLSGLIGFIATVSTSEDDSANTGTPAPQPTLPAQSFAPAPAVAPVPTAAPAPATIAAPGVTAPSVPAPTPAPVEGTPAPTGTTPAPTSPPQSSIHASLRMRTAQN
ncbi:MAG TPA: hypothetical protein VGM39_25095 [Kofleriaceae bacterium]|jgi:hypothetical protein